MRARLLLPIALASALFSLGVISHTGPVAARAAMVSGVPGTAAVAVHYRPGYPYYYRGRHYRYRYHGLYFNHRYYRHGRWHYY